ncbi:MAG TPA: ATP-binding cassette domain-containing protein [Firmicutes bacterium]|nr:ATP-binding cassette domain-containing protein [Bacillota bacterium]
MIHARGVAKVYENGTQALQEIDLQVAAGELVYVVGASGAGKTTLLKLLLGMEKPTAGELEVAGISLGKAQAEDIRRLRRLTGAVFQDFKLIPGRTALENVALSLRVLGVPWSENRQRSLAVLEEVGLADRVGSMVQTLSWGERQRVALARAVVREPRLLLADEPTGNLDATSVGFVAAVLARAGEKGITRVVATHDTRLLEMLPGRVLLLEGGRLHQVAGAGRKDRQ